MWQEGVHVFMCSCENEHNPQWRCGERFTVQGRNSSVMLAHITAAKNCWKKRANISRVSVCKCDDYIASVAYSWETEREREIGRQEPTEAESKLCCNYSSYRHAIYVCWTLWKIFPISLPEQGSRVCSQAWNERQCKQECVYMEY